MFIRRISWTWAAQWHLRIKTLKSIDECYKIGMSLVVFHPRQSVRANFLGAYEELGTASDSSLTTGGRSGARKRSKARSRHTLWRENRNYESTGEVQDFVMSCALLDDGAKKALCEVRPLQAMLHGAVCESCR